MSRKQFKVAGSTHEKKITKKERKSQIGDQQEQMQTAVPQEEIVPTEEDTAQIKNLFLYSCIGIGAVLLLMYWIFINSQ